MVLKFFDIMKNSQYQLSELWNNKNHKSIYIFKILTIFILLLSLLTILLGPYVRAEDAGMACPDWPLCHGYVIPPLDYQIYLEFIHRLIAGVMGIIYLVWFFIGIKNQHIRKRFLPYLILSSTVLLVQILLGRETITRQLNAYVVKFHLLNAIFYISIIYYIFYKLYFDEKTKTNEHKSSEVKSLNLLTTIFLVFIYLQIFLGGRVSANYVGLVCSKFPHCYTEVVNNSNQQIINTVYIPPLQGGFEMHFTHRFFGIFLLLAGFYLFYQFYKNQFMVNHCIFLVSLLMFQVFLGIMNIIFELPTLIRVLHSFTATLIFLSTLHIKFKLNTLTH